MQPRVTSGVGPPPTFISKLCPPEASARSTPQRRRSLHGPPQNARRALRNAAPSLLRSYKRSRARARDSSKCTGPAATSELVHLHNFPLHPSFAKSVVHPPRPPFPPSTTADQRSCTAPSATCFPLPSVTTHHERRRTRASASPRHLTSPPRRGTRSLHSPRCTHTPQHPGLQLSSIRTPSVSPHLGPHRRRSPPSDPSPFTPTTSPDNSSGYPPPRRTPLRQLAYCTTPPSPALYEADIGLQQFWPTAPTSRPFSSFCSLLLLLLFSLYFH